MIINARQVKHSCLTSVFTPIRARSSVGSMCWVSAGQLNIRHKTGYTDQNQVDPGFENEVKAYTLVDISGTWSGLKNTTVTLGVKNLFDTKPPFTNQGTVFQKGYDPRFADAVGRAYMIRAAYNFK